MVLSVRVRRVRVGFVFRFRRIIRFRSLGSKSAGSELGFGLKPVEPKGRSEAQQSESITRPEPDNPKPLTRTRLPINPNRQTDPNQKTEPKPANRRKPNQTSSEPTLNRNYSSNQPKIRPKPDRTQTEPKFLLPETFHTRLRSLPSIFTR